VISGLCVLAWQSVAARHTRQTDVINARGVYQVMEWLSRCEGVADYELEVSVKGDRAAEPTLLRQAHSLEEAV
jgi:hypothetical protein